MREAIFRSTYEHVEGNAGEVVDTFEGPVRAAAGDWVIKGPGGELWSVGAERFARQYEQAEASEPRAVDLPAMGGDHATQ